MPLNIYALKVGDRVGFRERDYRFGFGTVSKINGHGHITVDVEPMVYPDGYERPAHRLVFDRSGYERGNGVAHLEDPVELERFIERKRKQRALSGRVDELRQAIDDLRCYDYYRITAADKARLLKLVEAIEPLEEDDG